MLLSSFGAKFWKTWCGLCEVLIGRWGRLGANFTNTLLIANLWLLRENYVAISVLSAGSAVFVCFGQ